MLVSDAAQLASVSPVGWPIAHRGRAEWKNKAARAPTGEKCEISSQHLAAR